MLSNQVVQTCIDDIYTITKIEMAVLDLNGNEVAATLRGAKVDPEEASSFLRSKADSQISGGYHWFKVMDEEEPLFLLVVRENGSESYVMGKIALSQLQNLNVAYKEKFDKNNFFQNLLLDNLLLVDVYNRAKKLRLEVDGNRAVFLIETQGDSMAECMEMLRSMFSAHSGDHITSVDENNIVVIKSVGNKDPKALLENTAATIVDMMNAEAMARVRVAYGSVVDSLKSVSKSYKEAKMALEVGEIFYAEKNIISYASLGIGRLIYQLPVNLCQIFIREIFGEDVPEELDEETIGIVNKFFENNLNVSETSKHLFIHRNTLTYKIDKLFKATGLNIREFDDALTFKIALMVVKYMKYLETEENSAR